MLQVGAAASERRQLHLVGRGDAENNRLIIRQGGVVNAVVVAQHCDQQGNNAECKRYLVLAS